jgi:hypothetical protein
MFNLLILSPAPISAIAASRGTGIDNLLSPHPLEVWADVSSGTAATISIDLGAARSIDTVFLGHVRPPAAGASWSITGGVAGYAETTIAASAALRVPDVAGRSPALSHAFWHGAAVTVRYIQITVTQPNTAPALTVGIVQIGKAFVPSFNKEWGSGRRLIDTGTVTPLPDGSFASVEGVRKSAYFWSLGDLADAELDQLYELSLDRGTSRPLLVVEDPAATAGLRRRIHYGLFGAFKQYERQSPGRTRWELSIEEWGGDESAPL